MTTILKKCKKSKTPIGTLQDLQREVKMIKTKLKELKAKQQRDSEIIQSLVSKQKSDVSSSDSDDPTGLPEVQNLQEILEFPE